MRMNIYRRQFLYNLNQFIHTYYIFLDHHGSGKGFYAHDHHHNCVDNKILNIGAFVCFGAPI